MPAKTKTAPKLTGRQLETLKAVLATGDIHAHDKRTLNSLAKRKLVKLTVKAAALTAAGVAYLGKP